MPIEKPAEPSVAASLKVNEAKESHEDQEDREEQGPKRASLTQMDKSIKSI